MDVFYSPEKDKLFEAVFGRAIIAWNYAESQVREVLMFLASDRGFVRGLGPLVLVAEMKTRHLSQTIQTYADAILDDEVEKKLVKHVACLFDNLAEYRNHYVHDLIHIDDDNVGYIGSTMAKSKLRNVHGDVKIEDMGAFLDKVGELGDFTHSVVEYLVSADHRERVSVPGIPPLLAQLKKQTILLPLRQAGSIRGGDSV